MGRSIVADCESETSQTPEYLYCFLNPLPIKHDSYMKDTYIFISLIKNLTIRENSFFFTIDIDTLYTNIDRGVGVRSI